MPVTTNFQPVISRNIDDLLGLGKRTQTNDVERHTGEDKDVARALDALDQHPTWRSYAKWDGLQGNAYAWVYKVAGAPTLWPEWTVVVASPAGSMDYRQYFRDNYGYVWIIGKRSLHVLDQELPVVKWINERANRLWNDAPVNRPDSL